ncbi:D-xylose-proton symporter-like 2 [Drosophila subobscura]|uniref:D-xylose-proton symporter-like 2 n=1 Tax=Drosophila subobscura TaxID=7241 RepID=UPI00155AB44A|nr:D-xylose-proton symporter-like 2 [Drosophila subobscura]
MQTERPTATATGFQPIPNGDPGAPGAEVHREMIYQTGQGTCCNQDRRNQPQANAIGAAALIFLSGGLHIAWSIGFDSLLAELEVSSHLRISWFVAAIVGALLGGFFSQRLTYKQLMQLCAMLTVIGGVVMGVRSFNAKAMFVARYLNGFANGLAFAPTLAMAGELSVYYRRGTTASAGEQWPTALGIFVQIVCSASWDTESEFTVEQFQGVLSAILGVIAICMAWLLTIESPVDMLHRGDEQAAIDALSRLHRPRAVTAETYDQLDNHRTYLAHNQPMRGLRGWTEALPALLHLCLLRGLYAMSSSMLVAYTLSYTSTVVYPGNSGPFVLFGLLRLVGSCASAFALDTLGRKIPLLLGLVMAGGLAAGVASRFVVSELLRVKDMRMALWLLLLYQLFAGIAFGPSSAYLSEAFPRSVKRQCIALAYALEMIIQLGICRVDLSRNIDGIDNIAGFFFSLAALLLAEFLCSVWCMPETKMTTLRQAQIKFRNFVVSQQA